MFVACFHFGLRWAYYIFELAVVLSKIFTFHLAGFQPVERDFLSGVAISKKSLCFSLPFSGFYCGCSFQLHDLCSQSHTAGCEVTVRRCCCRPKISGGKYRQAWDSHFESSVVLPTKTISYIDSMKTLWRLKQTWRLPVGGSPGFTRVKTGSKVLLFIHLPSSYNVLDRVHFKQEVHVSERWFQRRASG